MDQERIDPLRAGSPDEETLALILYLNLPQAEIEKWRFRSNALAVDRSTSEEILRLLATGQRSCAVELEDEAARALCLFANAGPDLQAFAIGLIEALVSLNGPPENRLARFNRTATSSIEEAQGSLNHSVSSAGEIVTAQDVQLLVSDCEAFLASLRGGPEHSSDDVV